MEKRRVDAPEAPVASGGYAQAVEICGHDRMLFVSGQIPETREGVMPTEFTDQCRLVWRNVEAQLRAADMSLDNIIKVTTFLSDRRFAEENGLVRRQVLKAVAPALTVVIADIFDPAWLLEIEVIAAA